MKYRMLTMLLSIFISNSIIGQYLDIKNKIDSLLNAKTEKPFNGIVEISRNGKVVYNRKLGYSDFETKTTFNEQSQFVIGSISKQFTAVMVLREYDKKRLGLFVPIKKYLPELTQSWADTVTVHHLLTHMHGIRDLDKPTAFKVGTQFEYSQIGFDLLAKIIEKTSGKSFAELSREMFIECGMKSTSHPALNLHQYLVKGYTEHENGEIQFENESLSPYAAAGGFISTIKDLEKWNERFYKGKLLKKKTMALLTSKQKGAVRNHPIFGMTEYGYGITIDTKGNLMQYGQTGYAPGFVSMNFYFPETKTSAIVLMNLVYSPNNLKESFYYHSEILKILRDGNFLKTKLVKPNDSKPERNTSHS
jgi:D-alanyl-D-alanine carboxypeptidase